MENNKLATIIKEKFPQIKSIKIGEPKAFHEVQTLVNPDSGLVRVGHFFYKTLTSAGIKEEGYPPAYFSISQEACEDHYQEQFIKFLEDELSHKTGDFELIWREQPKRNRVFYHPAKEISATGKIVLNDGPSVCFWMYSRLLIREVPQDEK